MLGAADGILTQYLAASTNNSELHGEVAQEFAFLLRLCAAGLRLTDEFAPTILHDEKYSVRMAGLQRMGLGLTTVFAGAEQCLSEKSFYSSADLRLLLGAVAETLPVVKKVFEPDFRQETRHTLELRRPEFSDTQDAQAIQKMIDELKD